VDGDDLEEGIGDFAEAWFDQSELAYVVVVLSRMQGCYNVGLGLARA
jgi:hypothetical protein